MSIATPEVRTNPVAGLQLRDLDVDQHLTELHAIAVPYNVSADIGWFTEEFAPGSLAKSIKESARALPLLLFHDAQSFPIGVAREWDEKPDGLYGTWELTESEVAQRAAKLARDGVLNFMSIRFAPIRSEWTYAEDFNPDVTGGKDHVRRTEARLVETSLVSTPAYNGAAVQWVRTGERALNREARGKEIAGWREYVDRMRLV